MMAFEYYTYGNREVRVEKQMWQIRVVGYFLLAVPGYATFVMDDLMPPLLPSIFGVRPRPRTTQPLALARRRCPLPPSNLC